ncbi:hypothetical protein [Adhaeribacter aerolatus]|uniref:hypothetical protein n=1 Tax=Adhaeribacter aerolatus TaxID=670289 RepID=UPI0011BF4A0F|nr:hypothetical protein [Adhaeribacter aerolatus]
MLKPFYSNDKQYWKVVLLCFMAAATFWFLNALNKTYTNIRTSYPIQFVYDEKKLIPLKPLPEEVDINVTGKGWKMLRKSLMLNVRPAEIMVYSLPRQSYLTGSALRPSISGVLDGLQLNFVLTDTIHFRFDRRLRRKIPLAVDSAAIKTAANTVIASPIAITPDSIVFDGPASMVSKLPSPFQVKLPITNIDRSFKRFVPVEFGNSDLVKANVPEVEVSFAVSPLIWEEKMVVPVVLNAPEGAPLQLQPPLVSIRYGYRQSNAAAITPEQFGLTLNYANLNPVDSTVAVEVARKPVQVHQLILKPNRVKILPALPAL